MNELRIGVLGAGRIGRVHMRNLASGIPGAQLAALADVSLDHARAAAAEFGHPQVLEDYRDLLHSKEIDAVAICTPTYTHYAIILEAASAGKQIFCEKPVDLSLDRIRHVNDHVGKCGVQLMVAFNRRFDPNFQKLYEMVRAGKIGSPEILRITSRDSVPPPESYLRPSGGLFFDMSIHDFDMARYLMGSDIVEVYARAGVLVDPMFTRAGDWDTAVISLRFENGAVGAIDNSRRTTYGYDQRAEVFGSEGMVATGNNTPDNHVHFDRAGGHSSPPLHFFMERYTESYRREMEAFVTAIREGKPVPVNGADGLTAAAVALAAAKSVQENRPITLQT